jgi:hypothetical protein
MDMKILLTDQEKSSENGVYVLEREIEKSKPVRIPSNTVLHFKNAAARLAFEQGKVNEGNVREYAKAVQLKQEVDSKTKKQFLNDMRYAQKINSSEWKAKAAEANLNKNI